jgi:hypothetical protein
MRHHPARHLGAVLAAATLVVFGLAAPAGAETSLTVQTTAGSFYQPGRPIPVVVTVTAGALVRGEVTVRFPDAMAGTTRRPVEVPGGSSKRVVLVVEPPPWSGSPSVTFSVDGTVVARGGNLRAVRDEEPVGVLPALARRALPETAPLAVDVGQAHLFPFDPALLAHGAVVLAPFSHLLSAGSDIEALDERGLAAVLAWVDEGGRLIVDEDELPARLAARVAGTGDRSPHGLGEVVLSGGAAGDGRLQGLFVPSAARSGHDLPWGGMWFPSAAQLALDAGVEAPRVGALLGVIGAYVVLVGPVLWIVLRRTRRELLLWAAVPAAAAAATAVVYVGGQQLRAGLTAAHTTLVVDHGAGATATSDLLVSSARGGRVGIELPDRWHLGRTENDELPGLGAATWVPEGAEASAAPGSFALFRAFGPVPATGALEVSASLDDQGRVVGTVTNRTGHGLSSVVVFAGGAHDAVGQLGAGARAPFRLGPRVDSLAMDAQFWHDQFGRIDPAAPDTAVAPGALARWLRDQGPAALAPGVVTAIGWSRDLPAPVTTLAGEAVEAGRTGFIARRPVLAPGPGFAAGAVRTTVVRGPGATRMAPDGRNGITELGLVLVHALPAGADHDHLVMVVPARVNALDLWMDGAWHPVRLDLAGAVVFDLPRETVVGGVVYSRVGLGPDFWDVALPHPLIRSAQPADSPLPLTGGAAADPEEGADA